MDGESGEQKDELR